jgi:hypothetical protein
MISAIKSYDLKELVVGVFSRGKMDSEVSFPIGARSYSAISLFWP